MDAIIDLNADLGETVAGVPTADDEAMFAVISSASIACGGHAGDEESMREAIDRALRHGVAIGAHPAFADPDGFGRVALAVAPDVLRDQVADQLEQLVSLGAELGYVKPHGALYHRVIADAEAADAVAEAVAEISGRIGRALPVLGMDGRITDAAARFELPFFREAFLDRGYLPTGALVPRGEPGALLHDADAVAGRAVRLATEGVVEAVDGTLLRTDAVSLCVHGDSPGAVAMARAVRAALDAAAIKVVAPW
ncbi:5-oxoprolinase subunit PxpA [Microbacterium sp. NIBRBAC000506063]|uniref:5-oxoprolinase subunit PxpA n=1 Tax=Microbacterium sp. NIBRBAC000506063 TaxID=2734618 RepID=UPI001BB647F6|nr:5-oxoprolinase subunit PxpA [Microbacterium sp. NIBRBAC000506063]QTV80088.1 LamB/YcsF family protein [Microbacterium sp. NIBRBAC000506063]